MATIGEGVVILVEDKVDGKDTFKIAFENVKGMPVGTKLFARYSAKLNSDAVVGGTGNPNEADLTYSNNPDDSGRGDSTDKGIPDSTHSSQTGTTPKERTITYTAEIDILKTKGDGTSPLAGAEFTLTGTSTKTVLKSKDVYTAADNGTWYRLTDALGLRLLTLLPIWIRLQLVQRLATLRIAPILELTRLSLAERPIVRMSLLPTLRKPSMCTSVRTNHIILFLTT